MFRRNHVEMAGDHDRRRMCAGTRLGARARARLRMDGFDQTGLADRYMDASQSPD